MPPRRNWRSLPTAGGHHRLFRPYLHLHHQDAAGVDPAEEGRGHHLGSKRPNTDKGGQGHPPAARDIAKAKEPDLTAADLDAAVRTIAGSARSMGLVVEVKTMALKSDRRRSRRQNRARRTRSMTPEDPEGQQQGQVRRAIDVAVRLGVDAKKSDQQVRGSTVLPAGTGNRCAWRCSARPARRLTSAGRRCRRGRHGRPGGRCRPAT